ncbi:MAG: Spy/CpxP family protein refolding chaperone [Rhizomicrobium sp.]
MTILLSAKTRLILLSSAAICALAIGNPAAAAGRGQAAPLPAMSACDTHDAGDHGRHMSVAVRIKHLHDQLKIAPEQEAQWSGVAQVMLDNASAVDDAVEARAAKAGHMSAVDDLLSYQAIVVAHAEGLKKLAAAFAPLYAAMPEPQQRIADAVFGHRTASRLRARR